MTLIEIEGFLRGKCQPRDILVGETDAQYLFRKLSAATKLQRQLTAYEATVTNLNAQVQGLTAENAVLKGFITDDCQVYDKVDGRYRGAVYCIPKTPHIDAALSEIRAQGVEMLAEHVSDINGMLYAENVKSTVANFAQQLRKEQRK